MVSDLKVPIDLIEQINKGNVTLVISKDLLSTIDNERYRVDYKEFIRKLAKECDYPADEPQTLPLVGSYYEAQFGRHQLTEKLIEEFSLFDIIPPRVYQLISELPFPVIVTTSYDQLMEKALMTYSPTPYHVVIGDSEVPYQSTTKKLLVKLFGSVEKPGSLVITEQDHIELFEKLPTLSMVIRYHFATKTLLFLGFDLQDEFFRRFYSSSILRVDRHKRRSYAIMRDSSPLAKALWANQNIEIIIAEPTEFLSKVTEFVSIQKKPSKSDNKTRKLPLKPYKFLDYYEKDDETIFFGRDIERLFLTQQISTYKLVVIFGSSGVGKTSLIKAGMLPLLDEEGYKSVYLRALQDPRKIIKEAIAAKCGIHYSNLINFENNSIYEFIKDLGLENTRFVVVLDQFEEFFIRFGEAVKKAFTVELVECLRANDIDFHFVLSLREDYLASLEELEKDIPEIFRNKFRLHNLDRFQGIEAITKPAKEFSVEYDDDLLKVLIQDLESGGIEPPHLQIVCYSLYENLGPSEKRITLDHYKSLGEVQGLLSRYVDDVLANFETENQKNAVRGILKSMVTAEKTKTAIDSHEIARDVIVRQLDLSTNTIESILKILVDKRIVRHLPEDNLYELSHEVLVAKVWEWVGAQEIEYKYAREMLHQSITDWKRLGIFPTQEKRHLLYVYRSSIQYDSEELNMMVISSLTFNEDYDYWLKRAEESEFRLFELFMEILVKGQPQARHNVLRWLERNWIEPSYHDNVIPLLRGSLSNEYPALSRHSRRILQKIDSPRSKEILDSAPDQESMILIPDGEFIMGDDYGKYSDQMPMHNIYLDAFYIDKYPVTNLEYYCFVKATGHRWPNHMRDGKIPEGLEDHPVVYVDWYDTYEYAKWAGKRLPTEAEWEKAASWDDEKKVKRTYPWGNDYDPLKANTRETGIKNTTPIGQFSPVGGDSFYGVSDMSGNVWEWVSDWYGKEYYKNSPSVNPQGPDAGDFGSKIARGGSWTFGDLSARGATRYNTSPETRYDIIGFRCAKSVSNH